MRILITGITGMIGSHFEDAFQEKGDEVFGVARPSAASRMAGVDKDNILRADITDMDAFTRVVKKVNPDIVLHMAAQAYNGISWQMEEATHTTNYLGTVNVLRAVQMHAPKAKVLLACSSAEYGVFPKKDLPLTEERLLRPITPYGVSKLATEALGFQYFHNFNMKVYLPRLFIHVGTGHPPATAIQNFAQQLAMIKKGKKKPVIKVGNLTTARDFIDVRDGIAAMMLLLQKGKAGEPVNICTGKAYKISEVLDILIKVSGVDVKVVPDKTLFRVSDEPFLLGDNSKITKLGWKRKYTMKQTLEAVFADWLQRV